MSKYTYELVAADEGLLARCIEVGVEALGDTENAAVANLRRALAEKLGDNEAIAPPGAPHAAFELTPRAEPASEPSGPGDTDAR
jgi:hypothetical protein